MFNPKRFGNYLLYDMRNAWNNCSLSAIICGITPLIFFLIMELFSIVFKGGPVDNAGAVQTSAFVVSIMVAVMVLPVKIYGSVTDKRQGSNFLMLPASTLEKTLSIAIVTCVLIPALVWGIFFLSDWLLSVSFPIRYGHSLPATIREVWNYNVSTVLSINYFGIEYLAWCCCILLFTLGAVFFRRAKSGKTILCWFGANIVVVLLLELIFKDPSMISINIEGPEELVEFFNTTYSTTGFAFIAVFLACIFLRIKYMKH